MKTPTKDQLEIAFNFIRTYWKRIEQPIYAVLQHVSWSGMRRSISFYTIDPNTTPPYLVDLTWDIGIILELRRDDRHGGIIVNGCGSDMAYNTIYNLACHIFPDQTQRHPYVKTILL